MKYHQAVVLGRFQPLHKGHAHMIEEALKVADNVLVLIGSSQESRTASNPFTYEERKEILQTVFGDKIQTAPLKDAGLGNVNAWGDLLVKTAEDTVGPIDCFVLGEEEKNDTWFSKEKRERIALIEVSRLDIFISSTKIRGFLKENDRKSFEEFIPEPLHGKYDWMREVVLASK